MSMEGQSSVGSSCSFVTVDWHVPTTVIPRLWIGKVDAESVECLKEKNVTHALFLTSEYDQQVLEGLQLTSVREVSDPNENLIFTWFESIGFIAEGRRAGGVIVDVSDSQRCSSTIMAYLVEALGMSLDGALATIRSPLRDLPEPSGVLIEQLKALERWCISRFQTSDH